MSTTQRGSRPAEQPSSGWAASGITFAATMAVLVGTFQIMQGLVAALIDDFFVVARNYTFDLDVSAWGWIHLVIGAVMFVGFGLYARAIWAALSGSWSRCWARSRTSSSSRATRSGRWC